VSERCAVHPEAVSVATCPRCGSFACVECWQGPASLCAACIDAGHARLPLDAGGSVWQTIVLLVRHPSVAMGRVGEGPLLPPIELAVLAWTLGYALQFVAAVPLMPDFDRTVALVPLSRSLAVPIVGVGTVLLGVCLTLPAVTALAWTLFYAALRVVGGRASARATLRAVLYLQLAVVSMATHGLVVRLAPHDAILEVSLLIDLAVLAWATVGATAFAERTAALTRARARIASGMVAALFGTTRVVSFLWADELVHALGIA
jgi:hypothetical protein